MKKKSLLIIGLVTVLVLSLVAACAAPAPAPAPAPTVTVTVTPAPAPAPAPDPREGWPDVVKIANKPLGSSNYPIGAKMAEMVEKYLDVKAIAEPWGGGDAAMSAFLRGDDHIVIYLIPWYDHVGNRGEKPFAGAKKGMVRTFLCSGDAFITCTVREGAGIEKFEDMEGKRFMHKNPIVITTDISSAALIEEYGLEGKYTPLTFTSGKELGDAIAENRADAVWYFHNVGTAWVEELYVRKQGYILPIGKDELKAVSEKLGWVRVSYIPAGSFTGQDKDIPALGAPSNFYVRTDVPETLVYEITKMIYEHFDEWEATHPSLAPTRLPGMLDLERFMTPYHDGAVKYFKEAGFWTEKHDERQQSLLAKLAEDIKQ